MRPTVSLCFVLESEPRAGACWSVAREGENGLYEQSGGYADPLISEFPGAILHLERVIAELDKAEAYVAART